MIFKLSLVVLILPLAASQRENEVAFSVGLSQHKALVTGEKVVYDTIFTNVGDGYNGQTGIFTCPQSGLYAFQVHGLSRTDGDLYLELYHNSDYVFSVWGHTDNDFAAAGNTAIIQLRQGDTVYVAAGEDGVTMYGDPSEVYATFSGYLISPVFQDLPAVG